MNYLNSFSAEGQILIYTILILLITVILLFVYTFNLRIYINIKKKFIQRKQNRWEKSIFEYISQEPSRAQFSLKLRYRYFQIFGEFVENYLINLKGEDFERIIQLLRDIGYGKMLIKALNKTNKWGKAYAAHLLGLMNYKQAESKLLKLFYYDKSMIVHINSFEALNRIGSKEELPSRIKAIIKNKHIGNTIVIEILLGYGAGISPVLIEMLEDPEIDSRGKRLIVDILSFLKAIKSSKTILKLAKKTDDVELKIGCIKAFGSLEDTKNVSYLIESLRSKNWVIRSLSAKSLGKIGVKAAIPFLKDKLYFDKNYLVRLYSAFALKQMQEKGLHALKEVLMNQRDPQVCQIIIYVIQEKILT